MGTVSIWILEAIRTLENNLHDAARAAGACVEPEKIPSKKDPSKM